MIRETIGVTVSWTGVHHHTYAPRDRGHLGHPHEHAFTAAVQVQLDLTERGSPVLDSSVLRERVDLWCIDHLGGPHDMALQRMARQLLDAVRIWYGRDRGIRVEISDATGCSAGAALPWVGRPGRPPRPEVPE